MLAGFYTHLLLFAAPDARLFGPTLSGFDFILLQHHGPFNGYFGDFTVLQH